MKRIQNVISFTLFVLIAVGPAMAQVPRKAPVGDPLAATKQSLFLAEHGKCKEALQILKKTSQLEDKELKLKAGVATVNCALNLDQTEVAVQAIEMLNREFPRDPEVLYITTHAYSDLSTRASLELARTAPNSYQAHEMNAEALEILGEHFQVLGFVVPGQGLHGTSSRSSSSGARFARLSRSMSRTVSARWAGMIDAIGIAIGLAGPNTKIAQGHGPMTDRAGLVAHRDMIIAVRDRIAKMIQEGKTIDEVLAAHPTAEYDEKMLKDQPLWYGDGEPEYKTPERFVRQMYAEISMTPAQTLKPLLLPTGWSRDANGNPSRNPNGDSVGPGGRR